MQLPIVVRSNGFRELIRLSPRPIQLGIGLGVVGKRFLFGIPAEPPAENAAAAKGRPDGTDQPRRPADRTQRLARLLTRKDEQTDATGGVPIQIQPGEPVLFKPSVQGPAETLRKRFGQPNAVLPFQITRPSPEGEPKAFNWQLWIWGPVKVFVDETGTTRYFAVTEE